MAEPSGSLSGHPPPPMPSGAKAKGGKGDKAGSPDVFGSRKIKGGFLPTKSYNDYVSYVGDEPTGNKRGFS